MDGLSDVASDDSVTAWIQELAQADERAAEKVWRHFSQRLIELVRHKLRGRPQAVADEDDVVVAAFETLYRRAREGKLVEIQGRDDFWRLIVTVAERKMLNMLRDQGRLKRGGGVVVGTLSPASWSSALGGMQVASPEPTPEFAAIMTEVAETLFAALPDDEARTVAQMKLAGHSNQDIASAIGRALATVERRLKLIRAVWREQRGGDGDAAGA